MTIRSLANPARGQACVQLAGAPHMVCLTLDGLARLEAAFGLTRWSDLGARLVRGDEADLRLALQVMLGDEDNAGLETVPRAQVIAAVAAGLAALVPQEGAHD